MARPTRLSAPFRLVVVGHVDHGKSTLIGRLLHDVGALPEGRMRELQAACQRRGVGFEWSFILDAFQLERDQAITIDTSQFGFSTETRRYAIIDAPGHREFLRNMITGAAGADAAVLVIDALEGLKEQSRRHAYLLAVLGVRRLIVCINKMDALFYAPDRFRALKLEIERYLGAVGLAAAAVIPVSARDGANLAARGEAMPWYEGPTLVDALDDLSRREQDKPEMLRVVIQDVYRIDTRRVLVGRVEAGALRAGDALVFSPTGVRTCVRSIEQPRLAPGGAVRAGQAVGFTLDDHVLIERGEIASHAESPPVLSSIFKATLFWLGREPLSPGRLYTLKVATRQTMASVQAIERVIDTETLETTQATEVAPNAVAEVVLRAREVLALDDHDCCAATGRCVLLDGYDTVGGGVISVKDFPDQRKLTRRAMADITGVDHLVTPAARAWRNGHHGAVIWFTGLSGAGKSTLAMAAEYRLFNRGFHTFVLDGDNMRTGLNADLGFSPDDRSENVRRVGEVASLFAEAGFVVITSFISPYRSDRELVRQAVGDAFHEIFIKAELAVCEARDPKGLYRRARAGLIQEFTGVSSPYEVPERPDLTVDTAGSSIDGCVNAIVQYVERRVSLKRAGAA
jgi:bifunctional enzyme CysN/CysC